MREWYIKTDVSTEPVTLAEAKTYVNYLGSDSDIETQIGFLITSARVRLEHFTGQAFAEKTMVLNTSSIEGNKLALPYGPIRDIVKIEVIDEDGNVDDTLTADDDYYLLGDFDKFIRFESYSTGYYYKVEYRGGYGANTFTLPGPIKSAILRQVKFDFDHRGKGDAETINGEVAKMLTPYQCNFL